MISAASLTPLTLQTFPPAPLTQDATPDPSQRNTRWAAAALEEGMRLHLLRPSLLRAVLAGCLADPNAASTLVAALTTALAATKPSKSSGASARGQKQRLSTLARLAGPAASASASASVFASSAAAAAAAAADDGVVVVERAESAAEGSTDAVAASQTALLDALREKRRRAEAVGNPAAAAVDGNPAASEPAASSGSTPAAAVDNAVGVGWTQVKDWRPCAIGMLPSDSLCTGTVPYRSPPRSPPPPPAAASASAAAALAPTIPLEATEATTVGGPTRCAHCGRGGHRGEDTATAAATAAHTHDSSDSDSEGEDEPQPKRAALARGDGQGEPGETGDAVGMTGMEHDDGATEGAEVVATAPSMRLGGGWAALAPDSIAYMQSAMQSF